MKKLLFNYQNNCEKRIDKFIQENIDTIQDLKNISRNQIQEIIKNNKVKKNGITINNPSQKLKMNDIVEIEIEEIKEAVIKAKKIDLEIVYEDEDLIVINKQAGLTTHPGAGNNEDTLVNALLYHCGNNLSDFGDQNRRGIVHRLDKDTSGLMVVAKNNFSHELLKKQLENRTLKRIYNAVIWGNIIPEQGIIDGYIRRNKNNRLKMEMIKNQAEIKHNLINNNYKYEIEEHDNKDEKIGRYSKTNYKTLKKYLNIASLIECKLDTGRTHQIRVHFSSKNHPLIGDQTYGGNFRKIAGNTNENKQFIENFPRQALHSRTIKFIHPRTKQDLQFDSELPIDIKLLIQNLEKITNSNF